MLELCDELRAGVGKIIPLAAARLLAQGGKVAFRGFRGRYRLTWKDADGTARTTLVEVK